jgi:hypothetical protein
LSTEKYAAILAVNALTSLPPYPKIQKRKGWERGARVKNPERERNFVANFIDAYSI